MPRSKRSLEGTDLELYAVPAALRNDGYQVNFSHRSHGAYDHAAWKTGEILLVAARLTGIGKTNPGFSNAELAPLWDAVVSSSAPGFRVRAILATAVHAPTWSTRTESFGPCRCQPRIPVDELLADGVPAVRYLELTGPPVGQGRRPNWREWTPDYALGAEVREETALAS